VEKANMWDEREEKKIGTEQVFKYYTRPTGDRLGFMKREVFLGLVVNWKLNGGTWKNNNKKWLVAEKEKYD
jgi:hypothetical protein